MFSSIAMSQEIVVAGLHLNNNNYWELESKQQIKLLSDRVKELCELLSRTKPHATWIIAWQEYGVKGRGSLSISEEVENFFKTEFKKISRMYPNLMLLAGTLLTKNPLAKDNLKKTIEYYKPLKWIEDIDESYLDKPLSFEKEHAVALQASILPLSVITNKARVYHHGEEKCHGKLTPFYEEKDDVTVYQPGKEDSLSPVIQVGKMTIGVEICREHLLKYSVLKKYVEEYKTTPPAFHFILSSSVKLHLKPICASYYAFHVDSVHQTPPIITRGQKKNKMHLDFYRFDVLQPITKLPESIAPVYPLQYQMLDLFDEVMVLENSKNRIILQSVAENIIHRYGVYELSEEDYVGLRREIEKVDQVSHKLYEKLIILLEKTILELSQSYFLKYKYSLEQ